MLIPLTYDSNIAVACLVDNIVQHEKKFCKSTKLHFTDLINMLMNIRFKMSVCVLNFSCFQSINCDVFTNIVLCYYFCPYFQVIPDCFLGISNSSLPRCRHNLFDTLRVLIHFYRPVYETSQTGS